MLLTWIELRKKFAKSNVQPISEAEKVKQQNRFALALGWDCIVWGQFGRLFPGFPEILNNHLSNLGDVMMGASMFDWAQASLCQRFNYKVVSRPLMSLAIAYSVFTAYEVFQTATEKREHDWRDQLAYTISAAGYLALRRRPEQEQISGSEPR